MCPEGILKVFRGSGSGVVVGSPSSGGTIGKACPLKKAYHHLKSPEASKMGAPTKTPTLGVFLYGYSRAAPQVRSATSAQIPGFPMNCKMQTSEN